MGLCILLGTHVSDSWIVFLSERRTYFVCSYVSLSSAELWAGYTEVTWYRAERANSTFTWSWCHHVCLSSQSEWCWQTRANHPRQSLPSLTLGVEVSEHQYIEKQQDSYSTVDASCPTAHARWCQEQFYPNKGNHNHFQGGKGGVRILLRICRLARCSLGTHFCGVGLKKQHELWMKSLRFHCKSHLVTHYCWLWKSPWFPPAKGELGPDHFSVSFWL